MKRYTASQLRANLSSALDEVERGGEVSVERHGHVFRIVPAAVRSKPRAKLAFELTDQRLLEGGWTWAWQGPGRPMKLVATQKRKRRTGA